MNCLSVQSCSVLSFARAKCTTLSLPGYQIQYNCMHVHAYTYRVCTWNVTIFGVSVCVRLLTVAYWPAERDSGLLTSHVNVLWIRGCMYSLIGSFAPAPFIQRFDALHRTRTHAMLDPSLVSCWAELESRSPPPRQIRGRNWIYSLTFSLFYFIVQRPVSQWIGDTRNWLYITGHTWIVNGNTVNIDY